MKPWKLTVVLASLIQSALAQSPPAATGTLAIDWPTFINTSNPALVGMPAVDRWDQQPFVGNGREGMMAACDHAKGALIVRLGRSDVVDRRVTGDRSGFFPCFDSGRLPIGVLRVTGKSPFDSKRRVPDGGIDLWKAEGFGTCENDAESYTWRMWTPMGAAVHVLEIDLIKGDAPTISFVADPAVTERTKAMPPGYAAHPPAVASKEGDTELVTQAFPGGGGYTVAWKTFKAGNKIIVVSSIGYDRNGGNHRAEALGSLKAANDLAALRARHRAFWESWWPRSAIMIPDAAAQAYYYLQLYKLASAVRADGPMLDLMGPWYGGGPWPAIWWNLNVQLAYQLCAPANRPELLDSLVGMIEKNADAMGSSVPADEGGPRAMAIGRISSYDGRSVMDGEAGNLSWTLAVAWEGYRLTGDRMRAKRLLPLMVRAAAFHVARAKPGPDGKLHLPESGSPESGSAADCMYELGPMRWLLRTLVAAEQEFGWKHPDQAKWREVLANLTPFPTDGNGFMKGQNAAAPLGHRHWSHLLTIYPLRDYDPRDPKEFALVRKSVAYWTSDKSEWRGYSGQAAASMWSLLGEPEEAAKFGGPVGGANTLYREAGPCIETPLQAAATLQERLLTWDRRGLRIFAGTPAAWKDASFDQLRAPLGLKVSAQRKDGTTRWVKIEAATATTVRLEPRMAGTPQAQSIKPVSIRSLGEGWFEFPLTAGQVVLLTAP